LRSLVLVAAAGLALAACGSNGGSSPQRAVATFLAAFPRDVPGHFVESEARQRALKLWPALCDRVDPAIRRGLRPAPEATIPGARTACGAVVATMALDPGEGGDVGAPATISGTPRSAVTHGATSIVTVDVRYRASRANSGPPVPGGATIKVLVVKRDGRWWVATPQAFNPRYASRGGLSIAELRHAYAALRAAAR
jgi:hypothetical protein